MTNKVTRNRKKKGEKMLIPDKLKLGDWIGVVAPSNPITGENIEELEEARRRIERKWISS